MGTASSRTADVGANTSVTAVPTSKATRLVAATSKSSPSIPSCNGRSSSIVSILLLFLYLLSFTTVLLIWNDVDDVVGGGMMHRQYRTVAKEEQMFRQQAMKAGLATAAKNSRIQQQQQHQRQQVQSSEKQSWTIPNHLPTSPYAYSFILGGVDPDYPNYRDYLCGIFVSAYLLRIFGSTADMFLLLEMNRRSKHRTLPRQELELLRKLNVTLLPIPSLEQGTNFYQLQLHKFRILGLTRYRRVFHLDSDAMPLGNLDYLFHYSDPERNDVWQSPNATIQGPQQRRPLDRPPLLENFVIAGPNDPSNGGSFMLAPHEGDLEEINRIIQEKERNFLRAKRKQQERELHRLDEEEPEKKGRSQLGIGYDEGEAALFDSRIGWGYDIGNWTGTVKSGVGWTFCAASGDQGTTREIVCSCCCSTVMLYVCFDHVCYRKLTRYAFLLFWTDSLRTTLLLDKVRQAEGVAPAGVREARNLVTERPGRRRRCQCGKRKREK